MRERDDWYQAELDAIDTAWVPLAGARVLEIGCGDGNVTAKLARRAGSLVSCDIDASAVALATQRLAELDLADRVRFEVRDAAAGDPTERGAYDVVFFVQVLEHVPGWEQAALFDRVLELVAPGGCLFVSTPNRWAVRDGHDTGKLFIHWLPRRVRVPLARRLGWGLPGHDPSWPYPPVLHDYVSFAWMRGRARQAWPGARSSAMTFYPTVDDWYATRRASARSGPGTRLALDAVRLVGRWVPPNLYFGEKVVFARPRQPA